MAEIILTVGESLKGIERIPAELWSCVHRLEVRLDLLPEFPAPETLVGIGKPLVITCRLVRDGGKFNGSIEERRRLIQPYIRQLPPDTLFDVEWEPGQARPIDNLVDRRIILSHHDCQGTPSDLVGLLNAMASHHAEFYKIVTTARNWSEVVALKRLLFAAKKADLPLAAFSMGELGPPSRLLALKWGTALMYAGEEGAVAPGMLTLEELARLYQAERIQPKTAIYGIVGYPVSHSLSPQLHNHFFQQAGIDSVYIPLPVPQWGDFQACFTELGFAGVSVTRPWKAQARALCQTVSSEAAAIGVVNTLTAAAQGIHGDNVDWIGFQKSLLDFSPDIRDCLVLGAGGSARSVVYALKQMEVRCWMWNRGTERLSELIHDFPSVEAIVGPPFPPVDVVINTLPPSAELSWAAGEGKRETDEGRKRRGQGDVPTGGSLTQVGARDFSLKDIPAWCALDLSYYPPVTPFLAAAQRLGWRTQNGLTMLIYQAMAQQQLWTGQMPDISLEETMKRLFIFHQD